METDRLLVRILSRMRWERWLVQLLLFAACRYCWYNRIENRPHCICVLYTYLKWTLYVMAFIRTVGLHRAAAFNVITFCSVDVAVCALVFKRSFNNNSATTIRLPLIRFTRVILNDRHKAIFVFCFCRAPNESIRLCFTLCSIICIF